MLLLRNKALVVDTRGADDSILHEVSAVPGENVGFVVSQPIDMAKEGSGSVKSVTEVNVVERGQLHVRPFIRNSDIKFREFGGRIDNGDFPLLERQLNCLKTRLVLTHLSSRSLLLILPHFLKFFDLCLLY